jgi:hypothetical protein
MAGFPFDWRGGIFPRDEPMPQLEGASRVPMHTIRGKLLIFSANKNIVS